MQDLFFSCQKKQHYKIFKKRQWGNTMFNSMYHWTIWLNTKSEGRCCWRNDVNIIFLSIQKLYCVYIKNYYDLFLCCEWNTNSTDVKLHCNEFKLTTNDNLPESKRKWTLTQLKNKKNAEINFYRNTTD